jgi:hypothetical protein
MGFGAFFGLIFAGVTAAAVMIALCAGCGLLATWRGSQPPAPAAKPELELVGEKKPVQAVKPSPPVRIGLVKMEIGLPRIKIADSIVGPGQNDRADYYAKTGQQRLLVWLRVANVSPNRLVRIDDWGQGLLVAPVLHDEFGNHYARITKQHGCVMPDLISAASLRPGQGAEGLLVFELPVEQAQVFTLTVSRFAVEGADEDFVLTFQRQQIAGGWKQK